MTARRRSPSLAQAAEIAVKSSWYGDCLPSRDFPMLIDLYLQGRLDLDAFVSETIGIGDVEAAFDKMHRGEVLRSVVQF